MARDKEIGRDPAQQGELAQCIGEERRLEVRGAFTAKQRRQPGFGLAGNRSPGEDRRRRAVFVK